MKTGPLPFNSILAGALVFAAGCLAPDNPQRVDTSKKAKAPRTKDATIVRIYLESNAVESGRTEPVSVYRDNPISVNLDKSPVFTEAHIASAEVLSTDEGPAMKIQLNMQGSWMLDNLSVANRGKRIAIAAKWTDSRWLGAPRLVRRVADGTIVFMPDATPEELEKIVRGVNNIAAKLK